MDSTIGNRIRLLRKSKGMTGTFLARKIGVSQSVLSQIELDQVRVKADLIPSICDVLDVDIGYFFSFAIDKNATGGECAVNENTI